MTGAVDRVEQRARVVAVARDYFALPHDPRLRVLIADAGDYRVDEAIASLEGLIWEKKVEKAELPGLQASMQIISSKLVAGRPVIHVLGADQPAEGFAPASVTLEDVFFTRIQPYTPEELAALDEYICTIPRPPNRHRSRRSRHRMTIWTPSRTAYSGHPSRAHCPCCA